MNRFAPGGFHAHSAVTYRAHFGRPGRWRLRGIRCVDSDVFAKNAKGWGACITSAKLVYMKVKGISELISVVAIGALFGLCMNESHQKWHRLGREAYLAHQSQMFDKLYANPHSLMYLILIYVVLALPVFAFYKGIAFVTAKVLSAIADKNKIEQG